MDEGRKDDYGKPDPTLMPAAAEQELWAVLQFGAAKYGAENWRKVDDARHRYLAAAMRHINAYRRGETHDGESGLHPLAHAAISLIFILQLDIQDAEQG